MVRFLFLLLLVGIVRVNASYSESHIKNLLGLESQLILNFRNYAKELQEKLRVIKSALAEYDEHVKDATRDPELYLSNPFSTFRLIRHMSLDWAAWQLKMEDQLGAEQLQMQQRLLAQTPKEIGLKIAAQRLQSLLKFYNLEPAFFLHANRNFLKLNPVDCFHMGEQLYKLGKYHEAAEWLTVAADNYTTSPHNDLVGVPHWRVYEMRSKVLRSLNKFTESKRALSTAISLNHGNQQLLEQQQQLELMSSSKELKDPLPDPVAVLSELQQQCGGESRQDITLSCELITNVTPFLELAPLRVEDLYFYPYVMLYKDGIYDREIQHIKNAFARCPSGNKFEEDGGISGCLIPGSYSAVIRTLSVRLQDMAGLDSAMDGVIILEYGSTNPFKPFELPHLNLMNLEDVEASAILFLNDVVLGGAVTIPNLDIVVFPQRGDALLTFNEGNFEHTLCPNVVGSSMVIVKFMFAREETDETLEMEQDYITILSDKLELLSQNEKLQLSLMDYVDQLQERIDVVKKLSKFLRAPLQTAKGREKEFLSNPLNSFSLLRQMESDWVHVLTLLEKPIGQEQIDFLREMHSKRPHLQGVRDSMAAIHRIKETYKLKAWDMANGLLKGVQYNAKLSVLDCYEMGYLYYNASQFTRAEEWLLTARHLMAQSPTDPYPMLGVTRSDISSLLARSLVAIDNFSHARTVLLDEPKFRDAAEEWLDYFKANIPEKVRNEYLMELDEDYSRLCRSNYKANSSRLSCSYKRTSNPFLILAPFKMEQLSLDPYVVVFHDVVYSSEIARLERATEPLLEQATVKSSKTHKHVVSYARTVHGAWLPHPKLSQQDNKLVARIRQRIKDMTGLRLDSAQYDLLQLLNYGYGGHYASHYDFSNVTSAKYFFDDRIATALIYLNDVSSGGATIFPKLNLVVKPERGKVLHWYNMRMFSYDYDLLSMHAACPVIIGNKLAMTQWIYELDQMFIKPCREPPKHRKNVYF
ncbi:hypothetical protein ACLKA7_010569 [Drosophila subpalustris]